jgi:hypothetical protein
MHVGVLVLRGARRHEHGGVGGGALRGMHVVEATAERAGGVARVDMNTAERAGERQYASGMHVGVLVLHGARRH